MIVLKPLSAFKIVCSFSIRLGRTNSSSGVAPGDAISRLPVGHCPDLAPPPHSAGPRKMQCSALRLWGKWGLAGEPFFSRFPSEESCPQRTHLQLFPANCAPAEEVLPGSGGVPRWVV